MNSEYQFLSTTSYRLNIIINGQKTSHATGFLYEYDNSLFLITNLHCVTGINTETFLPIASHGGIPESLEISFKKPNPNYADPPVPILVPLYDSNEKPTWFIHPKFGNSVDVVAIPVQKRDDLQMKCINEFQFNSFPLNVPAEVFVIGFPLKSPLLDALDSPIWKKGSIASEPLIMINKLPKYFIDTATREGMSGSPVICRRNGLDVTIQSQSVKKEPITIKPNTPISTLTSFAGIYSGRIVGVQEDDLTAYLGIVWRPTVIEEIIKYKSPGVHPDNFRKFN